ncbi:MAG: hypothetical protein ACLFVS_06550 [Candidatus Acetothermia bacterium]
MLAATILLGITSVAGEQSDVHKEVDFSIAKAHKLTVLNEESLEFSFEVSSSTASGTFESSTLHLKLQHNYDVGLSIGGSSFQHEDREYTIPSTWTLEWSKSTSRPAAMTSLVELNASENANAERTVVAEVNPQKVNLWMDVTVSAHRNGMVDPAGKYQASLDVSVVDLNS